MLEVLKEFFFSRLSNHINNNTLEKLYLLKSLLYCNLSNQEDYRLRGIMIDYYINGRDQHTFMCTFPYIQEGVSVGYMIKNYYLKDYLRRIDKEPVIVVEEAARKIIDSAKEYLNVEEE